MSESKYRKTTGQTGTKNVDMIKLMQFLDSSKFNWDCASIGLTGHVISVVPDMNGYKSEFVGMAGALERPDILDKIITPIDGNKPRVLFCEPGCSNIHVIYCCDNLPQSVFTKFLICDEIRPFFESSTSTFMEF